MAGEFVKVGGVVRVGFAAMLTHSGKMLVGRRKGGHGAGLLAFPGGHIEYGETFGEAVGREVYEETGLRAKLAWWGTSLNNDHVKPREAGWASSFYYPNEGVHNVCLWFKARLLPSSPTEPFLHEPDKCDGWHWYTLDELACQLRLEGQPRQGEWLPLSELLFYRKELGL